MALSILNTMVSNLCLYLRYWWNGVNFSSATITLDRLYMPLHARYISNIQIVWWMGYPNDSSAEWMNPRWPPGLFEGMKCEVSLNTWQETAMKMTFFLMIYILSLYHMSGTLKIEQNRRKCLTFLGNESILSGNDEWWKSDSGEYHSAVKQQKSERQKRKSR